MRYFQKFHFCHFKHSKPKSLCLGTEASAGAAVTAVGERAAGAAAEAGGDQPVHLPAAGTGHRPAGRHTDSGKQRKIAYFLRQLRIFSGIYTYPLSEYL